MSKLQPLSRERIDWVQVLGRHPAWPSHAIESSRSPRGFGILVFRMLWRTLSVETPRPDHAWRAVDVNRPQPHYDSEKQLFG
ncbi:MAG UNVERIFIED_CONTAM: hypothetical protein LVR18_35500 [Planctomycetaceae bacterium]|jgi:hypothetical protein